MHQSPEITDWRPLPQGPYSRRRTTDPVLFRTEGDGRQFHRTPQRVVRVVLTEPRALYASALACLLGAEPDLTVVGTVPSDDAMAAALRRTDPDLVLLDLDLPGREVGDLCALVARSTPAARIVAVFTARPAPDRLRSLHSGAHGSVSKHAGAAALLEVVRRVAAGEHVHETAPFTASHRPNHAPTERELELLRHAAHGSSVRELAERLHLSEGTVRNYLSRTMTKLGARNRIEAISIAQRAGWL